MDILGEKDYGGTNIFGHDKDGNFEGYAHRDELVNEINDAIQIIKANTDVDEEKRIDCVYGLRAVEHKLKKFTNHDITGEKLNEYRRIAKMLLEKGTIKDRQKEMGGLVGFIMKMFK